MMITRREFACAAGAAATLTLAHTAAARAVGSPILFDREISVTRRDDTILRLGGDGGDYSMTWTADDRQLVGVNDGAGWPENPLGQYANTKLHSIHGGPFTARISADVGFPAKPIWDFLRGDVPPYYIFAQLAVGETIFAYLSTMNRMFNQNDVDPNLTGLYLNGAKLIYSNDGGRSWRNQDRSTPVIWEGWGDRSRDNMIFFDEPGEVFSRISLLQMGKGYELNRDGFVYGYSTNRSPVGDLHQLFLFRVPKDKLIDRSRYEFFQQQQGQGGAIWTKEIAARGIVLGLPAPPTSIVYNPGLDLYLMAASWGGGVPDDPQNTPPYLGLWAAPTPWGRWREIYRNLWTPSADIGAYPSSPIIAPRWISEDGRSLWICWHDFQTTRGFNQDQRLARRRAMADKNEAEWIRLRLQWRQFHPYFALNAQQFDIRVS